MNRPYPIHVRAGFPGTGLVDPLRLLPRAGLSPSMQFLVRVHPPESLPPLTPDAGCLGEHQMSPNSLHLAKRFHSGMRKPQTRTVESIYEYRDCSLGKNLAHYCQLLEPYTTLKQI
jgi:hypothetical protein